MSFKITQRGDQSKRPAIESMEASMHQKLVALGISKKMQGYIMGAFRETLAEFAVTVDSKQDS